MQKNNDSPLLVLTSQVLIFGGIWILGTLIGSVMAGLAAVSMTGAGIENLQKILNEPQNFPNGYYAIMAIQWFSAIGGFVLAPMFYWYFVLKENISAFTPSIPKISLWIATVLLVLALIPITDFLYTLNKEITLPASLKSLEDWAKTQEQAIEKLTKLLIDFKNKEQFIIALLVMACLAGFGEELTFRGVVQHLFLRATQNPHIAIWSAAFIFSFIHFQFYGFFPRLFLGALFGYLYYWTKNLWISVLAHFTNNGFAVVTAFLYKEKVISINPDTWVIPVWLLLSSTLIAIVLLFFFYQNREKNFNLPIDYNP